MAKLPEHSGDVQNDNDTSSAAIPHGDGSPVSDLATLVRREMRRADRTRTPLSLALFRVATNGAAGGSRAVRLWEIVQNNSRETDVPFHGDPGTVIVILLDTDAAGANTFKSKILSQVHDLAPSATIQQYPGPLFQNLLAGEHESSMTASSAVRGPASLRRVNPAALAAVKNRAR